MEPTISLRTGRPWLADVGILAQIYGILVAPDRYALQEINDILGGPEDESLLFTLMECARAKEPNGPLLTLKTLYSIFHCGTQISIAVHGRKKNPGLAWRHMRRSAAGTPRTSLRACGNCGIFRVPHPLKDAVGWSSQTGFESQE